jgi:hypothetical protein
MRFPFSLLLIALPAFPQILYNEQRDKQAQEALKLSGEIQNGQVFQKALDNLDELWKLRQDGVFRNAELQMQANLKVFRTWDDLQDFVLNIRQRIGPPESASLQGRLENFKAQETKTLSALSDLKKKLADAPNAASFINQLGKAIEDIGGVEDIVSFVQAETGSPAEQADAAKKATEYLQQLAGQFKAFTVSLPAQPGVLALQDQLALLKVQEQHIQNLMAIEERKHREIQPIRQLLDQVDNGLNLCVPLNERSNSIVDTLQKRVTSPETAPKDCALETLTFVLFNVAALTARNDTPVRLALLRSSMEDRANAIRLSAASTQQIEELIANGVERLAMFHKGGFKPANLAAFIQALATAGLIPAVVLK